MPTAANRRQRRVATASRCNAATVAVALAAGFSGSHQGTFGAPGTGRDTSLNALAPQTLLGAESWADLMDADDAAAEKVAGRGSVAPSPGLDHWGSHQAASGAVAGAVGASSAGGMHPLAPRAPAVTLCAAVWLCTAPVCVRLCVRLGHLGLEGTHPLAPKGAIPDFSGSY